MFYVLCMSNDEIERRLDAAVENTQAMTDALAGQTIGHKPLCLATAKYARELAVIVGELADQVQALRAEVERQTKGHD
jgi:hypothetical protein